MRKNLDRTQVLTLPFLSPAKPPTSKEHKWEPARQPSEWEAWGSWRLRGETRSCGTGRVQVAYVEFFFVGSLSWAILGNQRGALKLLIWKAEWQWKRGLGQKADANFVTDLPRQGEVSAHFFLKQNVISSPPTPQKWVADGKRPEESQMVVGDRKGYNGRGQKPKTLK